MPRALAGGAGRTSPPRPRELAPRLSCDGKLGIINRVVSRVKVARVTLELMLAVFKLRQEPSL